MISKQKDNYVLLKDEHDDACGFARFLANIFDQFESDNVVIDMLEYDSLQLNQLLCFLELSNKHRSSKQSFIIVNKAIEIDRIPEELMVVPTIQEAEDVIQMEEIERDLGF